MKQVRPIDWIILGLLFAVSADHAESMLMVTAATFLAAVCGVLAASTALVTDAETLMLTTPQITAWLRARGWKSEADAVEFAEKFDVRR